MMYDDDGPLASGQAVAARTRIAFGVFYTSLATSLEDVHGATKLPLGRRGRAADAIRGGMTDQFAGLEHEAGVRQQL